MSLGFGSVGELAIGEIEDENIDIIVPVLAAALAFPLGDVGSGKNIEVPSTLSIAMAFPTPGVAGGANIIVPQLSTDLSFLIPTIETGLVVNVPAVNFGVGFPAPTIQSGINILMPPPPETVVEETFGSVAEFAIGEADYSIAGHLVAGFPTPSIQTGINVILPNAADFALNFPTPEPTIRKRAVRVRLQPV